MLHEDGEFRVEAVSSATDPNAKQPIVGDRVAVHYNGTFGHNGEEFDSSYKRGRPFVFEIGKGRVIKCWDEAFMLLSKGMKARLHCPADYAYGSGGAGRVIPPNSDLIFDVELVEINGEEKTTEQVQADK